MYQNRRHAAYKRDAIRHKKLIAELITKPPKIHKKHLNEDQVYVAMQMQIKGIKIDIIARYFHITSRGLRKRYLLVVRTWDNLKSWHRDNTHKLWLGNINEAIKHAEEFDIIFCVMDFNEMAKNEKEDYMLCNRPIIIYAPVLKEVSNEGYTADTYIDPDKTEYIVKGMYDALINNKKILVHCAAAEERSPLVIVWFCYKYLAQTVDQAYKLVKEKIPQTLDRREWLEEWVHE